MQLHIVTSAGACLHVIANNVRDLHGIVLNGKRPLVHYDIRTESQRPVKVV